MPNQMIAPKMINRMKKAMAPLGLNDLSNSASVIGVLPLAGTNSVVSMKKCLCRQKYQAGKLLGMT
jgi:hypothetical protein